MPVITAIDETNANQNLSATYGRIMDPVRSTATGTSQEVA